MRGFVYFIGTVCTIQLKIANNELILILISNIKCMLFQNTQIQVRIQVESVLHGNKIGNVYHSKFLGIWE